DQANIIEGATVTLSGSATGGSGTITYAWTQVDADSTTASTVTTNAISLTNAATATATFTAPEQTTSTVYYFRLTATASSMSGTDIVAITVTDDDPPTVTISLPFGGSTTRDEGTTDTDDGDTLRANVNNPDGDSVTRVSWSATPTSPALPLSGSYGSNGRDIDFGSPHLTVAQRVIVYTVRAAVTDSVGNTGAGTIEITVLDRNGVPTANAGADQTVAPGQMVTLSGSGTNTAGGSADVAYQWIQERDVGDIRSVPTSAPNYIALTGGDTATPTFTAATPGMFYFALRVTDTLNNINSIDRTVVTVAHDPGLAVSVDNANVSEGGSATFTVALTGTASATPAMVDWAISGVDASDYTVSGADTDGTLRFTAVGSQTINVAITDDSLSEDAETLTFTLSNLSGGGSGAGINTAVATTIIAASDRVLTITGPATINETDADAESGTYTITLTGPALPYNEVAGSSRIAVTWTVSHNATDGTSDADFAAASDRSGTVNFFTNDFHGTAKTFTLTIAGDQLAEGDEGFSVQASIVNHSAASDSTTFGAPAATTIVDDEARRRLTITGPATITETNADAESGTYTITLTGIAFTTDTTVTWTVSHAATGGTSDADFAAASDRSGTVSFGASDSSGATRTFTLTIAGDQLGEGDEGFTVQASVADASADSGTAFGAPAATTITANDRPVTVQLTAPPTTNLGTAVEGQAADFTVSFAESVTTTEAVQVDWTITFPTASPTVNPAAAADFAATTGTFSIPAGMNTATLSITSADDNVNEALESYTVTISNPRGGGAIAEPA
ncbi:MAG: hypothetical protein OXU78_07555, partial [Deltaproteobacteria bacterium]|nr:hypothetical protein [Deltaproteobacteria bacterium]